MKSIGEYMYERQHNFRELAEELSPMLEKCMEWEKIEGTKGRRKRGWWTQNQREIQEPPI